MDVHPEAPPASIAQSPVSAAPAPGLAWPRSAQIALSVLLAAALMFVAGKSLRQSLDAGPSTLPAQRINLNSATLAELMVLPGVGETLAARIAKVRADKGPFHKVDDLRHVPGIGPAALERLRGWVFVAADVRPVLTEPALPLTIEPSKRPGTKPKKGTNLAGPIDVNTADATQLMQIPGIGPKLSQRIVQERTHRPFETTADLRRVHGIGPKILEKIRPFVMVSRVQ
jgi:competence protein ComEA